MHIFHQAIRTETGSFVSIKRNDNKQSTERILCVKGDTDSIVNAFTKIHDLLLKNNITTSAAVPISLPLSRLTSFPSLLPVNATLADIYFK
jgi:phosphohistidine swiveling domain-containing protein